MTIVSPYCLDVVSVVVGERGGVAAGCLLSAMSGVGEQQEQDAGTTTSPSPPCPAHDNKGGTMSDGGRGRRKLENEDSSYDSDFEPNERQDDEHEDVCRTVSDTLGAEFAEYVSRVPATSIPSAPSTITTTTCTPAPALTTPLTDATTPVTPAADVATPPATAITPATSPVTTPVATPTTTTPPSTLATAPTTTTTPLSTPTSPTTTTSSTTPVAATSSTTTATTPPPTPTTTTATTSSTTTTTTLTTTATATATRTQDVKPTTLATPLPPPSSPPAVCVTPPAPAPPRVTLTQPPLAPKVTGATSASPSSGGGDPGDTSCDAGPDRGSPRARYASQVEFGVKLGYTESLVQLALVKLGGAADKDELLAELIRLGTTAPRPEGDDGPHDDTTDTRDDPDHQHQHQQTLKPVIIDGSNVAMSHGNKTTFSCRGLRVCVDWFRSRGHTEITVFVPAWRKEAPRWDTAIADQEVLLELERERVLVFTPSRVCGGKRIVSYDDRYILKEAVATGGVVVSNDNYRDLSAESQTFRRVVEESLLMYSWVNGRFVPPDDPLGRSGPTLDVFLRRAARDKQAPCPYGRKCTYGNKCKYMHPERGTAPLKSVTERLQEQAQRHYQNKAMSRDSSPGEGLRANKSLSLPVGVGESEVAKKPLTRTKSIVPAVSLTLPSTLPSALTQETPSRDPQNPLHHLMPLPQDPRPQEQRGLEQRPLDHRTLDQQPLDPLRSSTLFKSDSALYHMYASPGYGSPAWGWKGQGGGTLTSPPSQYGSHLPLGKNLSDPDQASSDNPHRKLQRQLTLNPAFDSRLYKIVGFREPAPEHFPISSHGHQGQQGQPEHFSISGHGQQGQQQTSEHFTMSGHNQQGQQAAPEHYHMSSHSQQGQSSPSRSVRGEGEGLVVSPGSYSPYGSREQLAGGGGHAPLARHSSQDTSKQPLTSLPPHLYPTYSHPHVTRFASAPDPIWGGQQQQASLGPPHITRLNSTSDTRLNVYGGGDTTHYFPDVFEDHLTRPPPFPPVPPHHGPGPTPGTGSPGPIGSRPMSPQQGSVLHHSPSVSPRQHTPPQQHLPQQPSMALPSQQTISLASQQGSMGVGGQQGGVGLGGSFAPPLAGSSHEDLRLRVFYHLSNLFPEAQVRAVMAMYPEETDPQKICTYMLGSGGTAVSRPLSPQQSPGALPSSFPAPPPPVPASHEDARFRAFYHLSQLFPEAQVRAVLARHPDHTDPRQFCATLISRLSGNQS